MYTNRSHSRNVFARTHLPAFRWVLVAVLAMMAYPVVLGDNSQADQVVKLSVDDPRPVAKAIETLQAKYGVVITYEDPRYLHEGDIKDVTEQVRKDLARYEKGKAPRVLIPKGGKIDIAYSVSPTTGKPENLAALLQMLLDAHAANDNPGVFRVEQSGEILHVVPAQAKNTEGQWVEQSSILDARITLPEQERNLEETLQAITRAVGQATQADIGIAGPPNLLIHSRTRLGATHERARDVLVRALENSPRKISWRLFYGPDLKHYALNIYLLPEQPSPEATDPPPLPVDPSGSRRRRQNN
ncbi:MAG: hypothetical protein HYR55_10490 [Acidobacteria bacterium]|nr:hypothetical protein [Acidobacteriota bacterium]MBI3655166.1 hypothetical protein [Acidobacteriota bacterium]